MSKYRLPRKMKKEEKKKYKAAKENFIKTSQQSIFKVLEKEKQRALIIEMMKDDEKLGLYE